MSEKNLDETIEEYLQDMREMLPHVNSTDLLDVCVYCINQNKPEEFFFYVLKRKLEPEIRKIKNSDLSFAEKCRKLSELIIGDCGLSNR